MLDALKTLCQETCLLGDLITRARSQLNCALVHVEPMAMRMLACSICKNSLL